MTTQNGADGSAALANQVLQMVQLGDWYRRQRARGVQPAVAGIVAAVAGPADPGALAAAGLCPGCGHPAHPGQVCMVDVGDEPCNCDYSLAAGTEYDAEDRPYYRPENVGRWRSEG